MNIMSPIVYLVSLLIISISIIILAGVVSMYTIFVTCPIGFAILSWLEKIRRKEYEQMINQLKEEERIQQMLHRTQVLRKRIQEETTVIMKRKY